MSVRRASAAAMTCGIHLPVGLSAVRQALSSAALVSAPLRLELSTSPAEFIHRLVPEYAANTTGRTTASESACRYWYA